MQLIDAHCHVSPQHFPAAPNASASGRWPCMRCEQAKSTLMIGDKPFRELDDRSWNATRRIEDMDHDNVAMQVVSPMPELLSYWMEDDAAELMCDTANHQISTMVALHPNRFRGLGAIALQSPDKAFAQLTRLKNEFGLTGVEIGSNINGKLLGDPEFEPFYAALESLDLAVFVHALHPVATAKIAVSPLFTAFAGFPIDVAMAAASIIMAGVMDRYPRLRIGFSHGGGALGAILGRLDLGWNKTEGFAGKAATRPSEQIKKFFFDSNVYDAPYLRYLAATLVPGRVFVGTDYPYAIMQEQPFDFIKSVGLDAAAEKTVMREAALGFLNEPV